MNSFKNNNNNKDDERGTTLDSSFENDNASCAFNIGVNSKRRNHSRFHFDIRRKGTPESSRSIANTVESQEVDTTQKDSISGSTTTFNSSSRRFKSPFSSLLSPGKTRKFWRNNNNIDSSSKRMKSEKLKSSHDGSTKTSLSSILLEYNAPTHLHKACHNATSVDELDKIYNFYDFNDAIEDTSVKDTKNQNPLHVLSGNKMLSWSTMNQSNTFVNYQFNNHNSSLLERLTNFVTNFMLPSNHEMAIELDTDTYIPFERAIHDWIDAVYSEEDETITKHDHNISKGSMLTNQSRRSRNLAQGVNISTSSQFQFKGESMDSSRALGALSRQSTIDSGFSEEANHESKTSESTFGLDAYNSSSASFSDKIRLTVSNETGKSSKRLGKDKQFPFKVRMSAHAEMSLIMLSAILDYFEEKARDERQVMMNNISQTEGLYRQLSRSTKNSLHDAAQDADGSTVNGDNHLEYTESEMINASIVRTIASIPHLMKTLLLLKKEEKDRIFKYSVVQKAMMHKDSIGVWLTIMLQHQRRDITSHALSYLNMLSDVAETERGREDVVKSRQTMSYYSTQKDIIEAVSSLDGLIPSMLTLNEKVVEDVATTRIISRVLDKMITRSFAVSIVFCDSVFLAMLLLSFRTCVVNFVNASDMENTLRWIYIGNAVIFYFIIREIGKAVSLSTMLTNQGFWKKCFWTFWNIIDIFSIAMAVVSNFIMRLNLDGSRDTLDGRWVRTCVAITTALLWLKVLGLLKTINMQLATFVLAIVQITRDILWFLVIMGAAVVSFSQITFTLLYPEYCSTMQTYDERCDQSEYYLKVYSILLGDWGLFDRDEFNSAFSVTLFVLFSFMVVVILLNVLIAIVSDSYEKCLLRSKNLFGRARVMLLAELVSFQNLLHGSDKKQGSNLTVCGYNCHVSKGSFIFFCLSGFVICVWVVFEYSFYKSGELYGDLKFSIGSIFVNVFILTILSLILKNTGEIGTSRKKKDDNDRFHWDLMNINSMWRLMMLRFLGTNHSESPMQDSGSSSFDDWRGRVYYIRGEMEKVSRDASERTRLDMQTLESKINGKLQDDIHTLKLDMEKSHTNLKKEIQQMENRLQNTIEQNINRMFHKLQEQQTSSGSKKRSSHVDLT